MLDDSYENSIRLLAIECGETSVRAVMANGKGKAIGGGESHALSSDSPTDPQPGLASALAQALQETLGSSGEADFSGILLTRLTLSDEGGDAASVVRMMVPYARILSDTVPAAALASVTLNEPGIVVVAGKTAIAFGRCPEGREVSIGGWGPAMGEEGSCPWIARQALSAIAKAADGRGEATQLTSLFLRHLQATNMTDLKQKLARGGCAPEAQYAAAGLVGQTAQQGDAAAQDILKSAGEELALFAATALKRLQMTEEPVTVGIYGEAFELGSHLLEPFVQAVKKTAPLAQLTRPRIPLLMGTLALALQDLETPLTPDVLANLEKAPPL